MSIFEQGMDAITEHVSGKVSKQPNVISAKAEIETAMNAVRIELEFEKFNDIDNAISSLVNAYECAAFRVGVTEGLKLANSVRALIGSEGVDMGG